MCVYVNWFLIRCRSYGRSFFIKIIFSLNYPLINNFEKKNNVDLIENKRGGKEIGSVFFFLAFVENAS